MTTSPEERELLPVEQVGAGPSIAQIRDGAEPSGQRLAIAKAMYAARPFVMGSTATTQGVTIGRAFDWDGAPSYYQMDMLELADAAYATIATPVPSKAPGEVEGVGRAAPELLSNAEHRGLLTSAEALWCDLQENQLGGFSDINRPFYILNEFKRVIEKYGHRDIGFTWSKNDLDALATPPIEQETITPGGQVPDCGQCGQPSPLGDLCRVCADGFDAVAFGEAVKTWIGDRSFREAAPLTGVSVATLNRVARGGMPDVLTYLKLSAIMRPGGGDADKARARELLDWHGAARFWSRIGVGSDGECWPWLGPKNSHGYGVFKRDGGQQATHRLSLALATDCDGDGLLALHSCDNRICCNPGHLRWGTVQDKSDDMVARNRQYRWIGKRDGQNNPRAKLTDNQVAHILDDTRSIAEISRAYGVSKTAISNIRWRRKWTHIQPFSTQVPPIAGEDDA